MLFGTVMSSRVEVLCYRCLGDDHLGRECPRSRVCNIDGCRDMHNRLLHGNQNGTKPQFRPLGSQPHGTQMQGTQWQGVQPQGTQSQKTQPQAYQPQPTQPPLTRTTQGRQEVQFNRNDSTLAQETQGQGTGSTLSFTISIESVDGYVDAKIVAQSSEKICGGMKAVDWVRIKSNWQHLQDIPFPKLANRGKIDVLLGTDNYHLMYPKKEVLGGAREPCARLCPLGLQWGG